MHKLSFPCNQRSMWLLLLYIPRCCRYWATGFIIEIIRCAPKRLHSCAVLLLRWTLYLCNIPVYAKCLLYIFDYNLLFFISSYNLRFIFLYLFISTATQGIHQDFRRLENFIEVFFFCKIFLFNLTS